jgi:transposase InsO family protein
VPLAHGFRHLAVVDWFRRYVLAWRLSNTLDGTFCLETLDKALSRGTLADWYGKEAAEKIQYAEVFEICEYGRRPNKTELTKLFPFFD